MKQISKAINPKDNIEYSVGDRVCIYQGRFGHNNIITIKSMWQSEDYIYVSSTDKLPGTFINAIKYKVSDKKFKEIIKDKELAARYYDFNIIN